MTDETGPLSPPHDEMAIAPPRALLFDWDNTLVDTWPVIHAALTDVFEAMGHEPWTLAEVRARVRHSLRDSFPALFGARWERARDVFYESFERRHLEALTPLPEAETLVAALASHRLPLGIVSNKTGYLLRREVEHLGWAPHFGAVVGAGDAARDKPAPDAAQLALDRLGLDRPPAGEGPGGGDTRSIWFVGDSNVDMEIAHAAGFTPILVRKDAAPEGEFDRFPPAVSLPDCHALATLVSRL